MKATSAVSMNSHKFTALTLLSILTISGLWATQSADATISEPSVPEFTVGTDDQGQIVVKIKNQPFTSYYDKTVNRTIDLYYQIRTKDHTYSNWETIELYDQKIQGYWCREPYKVQNYNAEYTMLVIQSGAKQEFQVQALIGYVTKQSDHALDLYDALTSFGFVGKSSDWSSIHTSEGKVYSSSPTPSTIEPPITPPQTPQITPKATFATPDSQIDLFRAVDWQNVALVIMAVAITFLAVAVLALWRRLPKPASQSE